MAIPAQGDGCSGGDDPTAESGKSSGNDEYIIPSKTSQYSDACEYTDADDGQHQGHENCCHDYDGRAMNLWWIVIIGLRPGGNNRHWRELHDTSIRM